MSESDSPPERDSIQRWTAKRKAAVVLDLIRGKTTPAEVARENALTVAEVERWRADFLEGGQEQLRSHPRDAEASFAAREKDLLAKVGQLTMDIEILKIACEVQGKPRRRAAFVERSLAAERERSGG